MVGLAACEAPPPFSAQSLPEVDDRPSLRPASIERSTESFELEQYYVRLQRDLLIQGLLRTDGGTFDASYTPADLAQNFIRTALFAEYDAEGGAMVARETETVLRRWDRPVRMQVEFGDTIPVSQQNDDSVTVSNYAKRLARVTGQSISVVRSGGNFHVLFLNEDDRVGIRPRLQELVPGISEASIRLITNMPRSTLCLVVAFTNDRSQGPFTNAVAVIRGEHPDLLRRSCVHEELAQGLGLANDSAEARPSIFNDDEEFGLLTTHDEQLLRMLYDQRFRIGMTAQEAGPIAERLATEMFANPTN